MNLEDLVAAYNDLTLEESRPGRNDETLAETANLALDALEAENPALDGAVDSAIDDPEFVADVAVEISREPEVFRRFQSEEREALRRAGLNDAAIHRLDEAIVDVRNEMVKGGTARKPILPMRKHIESLRRFLREHRREAIQRVGLVAGGCVLVTVDVILDPEPASKAISMVFGGVLIDRGIPELRQAGKG